MLWTIWNGVGFYGPHYWFEPKIWIWESPTAPYVCIDIPVMNIFPSK